MFAEGQDAYARYGYTPDFRTLDGYFKEFERRGVSINLGSLVGTGGIRDLVIGKENRRATPEELGQMCALVDTAMREGALGLSSSLQYVPDIFNSTEEIVAMAKVAARHGGAYFTHQRSESGSHRRLARRGVSNRLRSRHPLAGVAPEDGLPPELRPDAGDPREDRRRTRPRHRRLRQPVPWNRASNGLDACLPPWSREGGRAELLRRLADPATRERVKADMARESADWENQWLGAGGGEGVMIAEVLSPTLKPYEGRSVASIAAAEKKDPRDVVIDIVLADRANAYCILSIMDEQDVRAALAHPLVSFDCDSGAKALDGPFAGETSHPRGWGSASRILGYYVREQKLLRLEEAVRKMTRSRRTRPGSPTAAWSRSASARTSRSSTRTRSPPARPSRTPTSTAPASRTSPSTACWSWTADGSPTPGRARRCAARATPRAR